MYEVLKHRKQFVASVPAGLWAAAPAIAAGVGNIAGSLIQGQQQGNLNLANREWSAQQAVLNRQFQTQEQLEAQGWMTQMSNTQMQRRVQDLKAAGLNPMLAVSQGGVGAASSPGISAPSGSMANTPMTQNPGSAWATTAQQIATTAQTLAQTDKTRADAATAAAGVPYAAAQAKANADNAQQQTNVLKSTWHTLDSEYDFNTLAKTPNAIETQRVYQDEIVPLIKQTMNIEIQRERLGLVPLRADADFLNSLSPSARNIFLGVQGLQGLGGAAIHSGTDIARELMPLRSPP